MDNNTKDKINNTLRCKDNKCTCIICPKCGAHEIHPDGVSVQIRAYKYSDKSGVEWSQCLICAGFYDENKVYHDAKGDKNKGWFK